MSHWAMPRARPRWVPAPVAEKRTLGGRCWKRHWRGKRLRQGRNRYGISAWFGERSWNGNGPGSTSASGAGAGNATGKGGLLGLTIQGGTLKHDSGNNGSKGSANGSESSREINISLERQPPQTAYGLTITSTADSGGGLPDLGVFVDEKVYTVYLDVKATPSGHAASWTLQYAWLRSASEGSQDTGNPNHEGLTPPFPLTREIPTLNPELVRTYLRYVIVVYAVMDERGQLQRMSVKQSPDKRLSGPILSALSQWVFQPAQLNGVAVPLKVLIGIPLIP